MKAVYASTVNHADPLAALAVGEQPEPQARPFWSTVSVPPASSVAALPASRWPESCSTSRRGYPC